jgi:hypothetical protein
MVTLRHPILKEIEQLLRVQMGTLPVLRQQRISKGLRVIDEDLALLDMLGRPSPAPDTVTGDAADAATAPPVGADLAVGGKGHRRRE